MRELGSIKRILIVGSVTEGALALSYAAAFRACGVEVATFDPEPTTEPSLRGRVINRLTRSRTHLVVGREIERYFAQPMAWDIVLVFKGLFVSARALAQAKRRTPTALWFCFDPDSPFATGSGTSSRHIRECIPLYDRYFIWSRALVAQLEAHGCQRPVVYLPFGFDDKDHFPASDRDPSLANVITFVGSYDDHRASVLARISDLPLGIYGAGWQRLPPWSKLRSRLMGPAVFGSDLRRVVTSSLATINMLRPQNDGSHNMRTFEVPAMGGLMVTSRSREQQGFFPEGDACLMYGDTTELRQVLTRVLGGEIDTEGIRRRAMARVERNSYRERARVILETAAELRFAAQSSDTPGQSPSVDLGDGSAIDRSVEAIVGR